MQKVNTADLLLRSLDLKILMTNPVKGREIFLAMATKRKAAYAEVGRMGQELLKAKSG
jgi:hypothetical protein